MFLPALNIVIRQPIYGRAINQWIATWCRSWSTDVTAVKICGDLLLGHFTPATKSRSSDAPCHC
jgi:hypothetical protein